MSKETYDFSDLDDILAEFRGGGEAVETPASEPELRSEPENRFESFSAEDSPAEDSAPSPAQPPAEATVRFERSAVRPFKSEASRAPRTEPLTQEPAPDGEAEAESMAADGETEKPARGLKLPRLGKKAANKPPKKEKPAKPAKEPKPAKPPRVYRKRHIHWSLRALLALLFIAFTLAVLCWSVLYLHPASGTISSASADAKLRLSDKLDVYVNNAASDALGDLAYIRKLYTIQESATVAPAPDPNGFGMTYDPADITALIHKASILLDGQRVVFDPTADFVPGEPICYYLDDTILVIAWKEFIERRTCTCVEVKIAHGSQIRRKLTEDTYGSSVQLYASELAKASNAVVAANADFYAFRPIGVTVYQRKLYRFNPHQLDLCFINSEGDMIFTRAGELTSEEQTQRFVDENDILFSLAFGPVLVDNGELQYCANYPMGEIGEEFSRSCIAMTDKLHYLLMTINWNDEYDTPRANVNELARIIYSKNVWKAYNLDGGQTSEIVFMGAPYNRVDWKNERVVSDIIYFATAIPEEVRS